MAHGIVILFTENTDYVITRIGPVHALMLRIGVRHVKL